MKTKNMTLIALMIALLAVFAQFTLPIGPVPITLQTFIILLIGALLPPKDALRTTLLYLIMGLVGLPVFTGFNGGLHSFLMPSFGFILSWIPATVMQSFYLRKTSTSRLNMMLSFLINYSITYLVGLVYMSFILNRISEATIRFFNVLSIGLFPFLIGDLMKIIVAMILVERLKKSYFAYLN